MIPAKRQCVGHHGGRRTDHEFLSISDHRPTVLSLAIKRQFATSHTENVLWVEVLVRIFPNVLKIGLNKHGCTALDRGQHRDIGAQTADVLAKIDEYPARVGSGRDKSLAMQIWFTDFDRNFSGVTAVLESWIPEGAVPTRATF